MWARYLAFALLILPQKLDAEGNRTFGGSVRCSIEGLNVFASEEGLPATYAGVEDGISVGDFLMLQYEVSPISTGQPFLDFRLRDESRNITIASYASASDHCRTIFRVFENCIARSGESIASEKQSEFRRDHIILHGIDSELRMFRYFRSDWSGVLSVWVSGWAENPALEVSILDCRDQTGHLGDALDFAFAILSGR